MKQTFWTLHIVLIMLMIQACEERDITIEINNHLEETLEIEEEFERDGEGISELEEKDKKLYKEMISLGEDDYDDIVALAEEAIGLVEERKEYLEKEMETIKTSKEAFMQIEPKMKEVQDTEQKEEVEELYEVMQKRYRSYDEVYHKHMKSLEETEELYTHFQDKDRHYNDIYSQIEDVNESYETIAEAYEVFNEQTIAFNEQKADYLALLKKGNDS